ncbi:MAG: hypothetical protein ACREF7_02930 [Candidatus Saccharimonadales bacterium]
MFPEAVLLHQDDMRERELRLSMLASELIDERDILSQTIRFAGSVLVEHEVELSNDLQVGSLMDALQLAARGDETAERLVYKNVATDLMERTIKAGFVSTSEMDITESGQLVQHGQSYRSVQANSLRYTSHPQMRQRVWAETKNYFRLEELINQGDLDDYSFVVFSPAERDMPDYFYSETQTLAIQLSRREDSKLVTETAFVAGKSEDGHAHDHETVSQIYKTVLDGLEGVARPEDNAELIDTPLLIHNSLLPNGVVDLVKLYDDFAHGTFYGQNRPKQDYLEHKASCLEQTLKYASSCEQISRQLINEADLLDTPLKASARLDQLSKNQSLKMAVQNEWIDPEVFGRVSARHIHIAREALAQGDRELLNSAISQAQRYDTSTSCPGAIIGSLSRLGLTKEGQDADSASKSEPQDKYGPLSFYCSKGHLNTRPKNHLIDRCRVCKISVKCS